MTKDTQKKQETGIVKKQDILENQVNHAYLSLGSNLGNRITNLQMAKGLLNLKGINILRESGFYKSKSWPNENFPYYFNIVLYVKTRFKLIELFNKIKFIEKFMGRSNSRRNYPRICDIDIIDFNGVYSHNNHLHQKIIVPHTRMHKRSFVLMPLYELNKEWYHPKLKKNIVNLMSNLSIKDLRSIKLT